MQIEVQIPSDGLTLSGVLHVPDDAIGSRAAVLVTHGFGGNKDGKTHVIEAELYERWGYVVLRIDYRGCGQSEGQPGRIIPQEQVADNRNAITWLALRDEVESDRIFLSGQSFGGAINVYTGGVDSRVAGVVSIGGWGDGLEKSRIQHSGPGQWEKFEKMMEEGQKYREEQGESMMVSRWDIVPIPEHLRKNLPAGSVMEFTADTAIAICQFFPIQVVANIAPRPLLLIHASRDTVTPTKMSMDLLGAAGANAEAFFMTGMDHFPFENENSRMVKLLKDWVEVNFPITP